MTAQQVGQQKMEFILSRHHEQGPKQPPPTPEAAAVHPPPLLEPEKARPAEPAAVPESARVRHPAKQGRLEAYHQTLQLEEGLLPHHGGTPEKTVAATTVAMSGDFRVPYPLPRVEAKLISNLL